MVERFTKMWRAFSELYAPAVAGGIFLCIADLLRNEGSGPEEIRTLASKS